MSSASPLQPSQCSDFLFVGVSGSGQQHQIGKDVEQIRQGVETTIPQNRTLRQIYIDYDAAPVRTLVTNGIGTYLNSVQDGIDKLDAALRQSLDVCQGRETWVIAGYSQGALVINAAIRGFFAGLPQVGKIILLADPARVPNQVGERIGTAEPGYGIFKDYQVVRNRILDPLPASLSSAVMDICDHRDLVCDYYNASRALTWPYIIPALKATHESYADPSRGGFLSGIGARAVLSLGAVPGRTPSTPIVLSGGLGGSSVSAGALLQPSFGGFTAGERVRVVLHSEEVDLGYVDASADGEVHPSVALPPGFPAGEHELIATGASGTVRLAFQVVGDLTPPDSDPAPPGTGAGPGTTTGVSGAPTSSHGSAPAPDSVDTQLLAATGAEFGTPTSVAAALLVVGCVLLVAGRRPTEARVTRRRR